ncbi:8669_t:CDS:1, partial [Acaulospora morrowiae]
MYEVLFDVRPFGDIDEDTLAGRICEGERAKTQNMPPSIIELIECCWDADPSKRPSAEDLCKILNAWKNYVYDTQLHREIKAFELVKKNKKEANLYTDQDISTTSILSTSQLLLTRKSKLIDIKIPK